MGLPGPAARLLEDFASFEDLPVALWLLSAQGRVLRANPALCRLLGRRETDLLGADAVELVVGAHRARVAGDLAALADGGVETSDGEVVLVRPDGAEVALAVRRTAVRDECGSVALVVELGVEPAASAGAASALDAAASRAEALLRLRHSLRRSKSPDAVAAAAADALVDVLGGGVSVFFVDPEDPAVLEARVVRTGSPGSDAELRRLYAEQPLRTDTGVFGEACAAGLPLVVQDPWGRRPEPVLSEYGPWLARHPVRSLLVVPLRWEGRVLGVLACGRRTPEPFADDDVDYGALVGQAVSTVLADAQLLLLERSRARRQRAVAEVTRRCDEALGEPDGVLDAAVGAVAEAVGGTCAAWVLPAEGTGSRIALAGEPPGVAALLQSWLETSAGRASQFVPRVLRDGRSFVVGRERVCALLEQVPELAPHADALAVDALYGVQLASRGQPVGVLCVGSRTGAFRAEDRRLVDVLADRVALALDNAELLTAARVSDARSRALVEHCSDLLLMADERGVISYASPAAARTFGRLLGRALMASVVPEDRGDVARAWQAMLGRPGPSAPVDLRVVDVEGRVRRLSAVANNLLRDPTVGGVVLTVRDVTEERDATARLARRADQQAALAAIGATALTAELDELYRFVASTVAATLDSTSAVVLRRGVDDGRWQVLGGVPAELVGAHLDVSRTSGLQHLLDTAGPVVVDDYRVPTDVVREPEVLEQHGLRSGAHAPVLVGGSVWGAVTAHSDAPSRFTSVDTDFLQTVAALVAGAVERALMSERVLAQATTDDLTGLPNRVLVQAWLDDALGADPQPTALLLLDLDDFKDVNDSLGHGAGDQVLAQLGHRLVEVVAGRGRLARLGGDEFAVTLRGPDAERTAVALADDVVRSVAEPFALPGIDVTLSTSIGIAVGPGHGRTAEQLLQAADMAMYRAKVERSRWAVYDAEVDSRRSERLNLLSELRVALSAGQLVLHYQPLVDLATERVVEVEALLRWRHPERGLLLPAAFLPTAEQTDLVHGLTRYVVRAAARQARAWRAEGWPGTVAVNVSPLALRPPDVVATLREELLRSEGGLTVELTESALVDERAREAVHTVAAAGISCSVDDFGTGWSSLWYLRDLPVRRLKLDRAFNRNVDRDEKDAAIVGSVVQMAHAVGLDVVAEGVETREVADKLRALHVDVAQGWLYGRAQPASALRLT